MARSYLKVYFDFDEKTDELNDSEQARLLLAMYRYAKTGEKPVLTGNERFLFSTFKGEIDRDIANYNTKISNGNLGGRPAKEKPNETENNLTKPNGTDAKPKETETPKNKDNKNKDKEDIYKTTKKPPIPPFFEAFWTAYPKHQDKQGALKAFEKLNPDQELLDRMISAIEAWKQSEQWTKDNGQFIPMPATWLNRRRWEDELPKPVQAFQPVRTVSAQRYTQRDYDEKQLETALGVNDLFSADLKGVS